METVQSLEKQRRRNPIPPEQRDAVDVNTTAALLGVSRRTIYDLIARGELASVKIGARRLIPRRARLDLLERRLAEAER
jgi:excisionase family DNA binding protein